MKIYKPKTPDEILPYIEKLMRLRSKSSFMTDNGVNLALFQKWVKDGWHNDGKKIVKFTKRCDYIMTAGLGGEAGEVLEVLKKGVRDKNNLNKIKFKKDLTSELGDLLYYLTIIASRYDITLEEVILENQKKLERRRKRKKGNK